MHQALCYKDESDMTQKDKHKVEDPLLLFSVKFFLLEALSRYPFRSHLQY